jgi:hypothetical protein
MSVILSRSDKPSKPVKLTRQSKAFPMSAEALNRAELACITRIEAVLRELNKEGYPGGLVAWALHFVHDEFRQSELRLFREHMAYETNGAHPAKRS